MKKGVKVLDLGCGDGTTALPAAKLGADVLGIDIAANLVAAGNRRAQEVGLTNIRFQEGDATNLAGLPGKTFDLVISVFGAMFAPKPFDVAKEMVRVTRPGGRIVMGNWIPNDPTLEAVGEDVVSSHLSVWEHQGDAKTNLSSNPSEKRPRLRCRDDGAKLSAHYHQLLPYGGRCLAMAGPAAPS